MSERRVRTVAIALLRKTLNDHRRSIIGWAAGLIGLVAVMLWVYPSIHDTAAQMSQLMEAYPKQIQAMFRMTDYTSGEGYLTAELFSFMVPLMFIAIGISWGASEAAGEEEHGTADLLFSLPVSRTRILLVKWAAALVALVFTGIVFWITLMIGGPIVDIHIPAMNYAAAAAGVTALGLLFCSIAFAAGAATGKRGMSFAASIVLALATFLLYMLAPLVEALNNIVDANPFQWAMGHQPLLEGFSIWPLLAVVGASLVFLAIGLIAFNRRDVKG